MKPPKSKVAHFENVDLRELRVTPASLRLRRCIIGASISYILIFTPVLAYFIHGYMMAPPDLSRPRNSESGQPSKTCSNRRLPSFHLGFHRKGRHVDGNGLAHVNDSRGGLPQSSRQKDSVANFSRDLSRQANRTASGSGSPVGSAAIGHQQATSAETEAPKAAAPILERVNRVDSAHLAAGGVLAAGAAENQMLQKQPQWEPGKQREASGQTQSESVRQDNSPAGFKMNELPVQIGRQEIAVGEDPDESSHNGSIHGKPASGVIGSAPSQHGRQGKLKTAREMVPASSQNDRGLRVSEEKQSSIGDLESSRKRKEGKPRLAKEGTLPRKQKDRVKSYVNVEFSGNDASEGVHSHVPSYGHGKDNSDVPREVAASGYRKSSYVNGAKGFGKDKRGYKSALSSAIGRRTAEELRRLRSDKLMLKLRKAHNLAKLSKDPKRGAVFGSGVGEEGSSRQVDIAFQRELAQLIEGKGRNGNQTVRVSGAGYRARSDQNGSDLSSVENSDKQRMIEGIPSNNKEANEVLSFAEFFKKHLSPNQRPSKVHSAVNALQGRRLMIDYMTKKKGKDTLQEGFPAGGWPEKPEASAPTKYTLDPYHPYISRRGDGWDFYDPLKPTTERNDARELAEQEFYSPDLSTADLQNRLAGRLLAPLPPAPVPFFGLNKSSLQVISKGANQNKGSAITGNESGAGEPANVRPAVSAAIRHSFPVRKAKLENSGQEFRANRLSPNLINRYAVTEGTISAVFQHETAVGGESKKSESSSKDAPSGQDRAKSDTQMEQRRHGFRRSEGDPVQGDVKKFPPGNLIDDESPRSITALPVIGSASKSSASSPEVGQGDVHDNVPDSNATAPYFGNHAGSGNDKSADNKAQRGNNDSKDNKEDQKLQKRGSAQNERNAEVQNNGLPSSGSRASEADEKRNSIVFAEVYTNRSHAIVQSTGGSVAVGTKVPEGDSASLQNRKVEFAHNSVKRSTSEGNAAVHNDSGASKNSSMVHAGLMNIEPIPIERPDFIAIRDNNDTNVTTAGPGEDWAALSTHGKEYDDIVPEKERDIFQSRLNHNHNTSFHKEDALSGNLSTSVPTSRQNETQSFEPEVMDLTPPRGLTSPSKRELTRSRGALSSPGSAKPAPLAPHLTTDEIDNVDDARNREENYLRIDARAVTKEKFTEPPNIHIIIQNKRETSGKLRTTGVALNEVPKLGVPNIYGNHIPSARDSTKYFSQNTTNASLVTQARTSELTTGAKASTEPRQKSGLVSTPEGPEKSSTPNQSIHRITVYTTNSSDERERKGLKNLPSEGFAHRNVTVAVPKIRPSVVTRPTRHTVKLENRNTIVIEVLRKRRGHRQLPFESTKVNDDNSSHSYTGTGHHISTMAFKNASNTDSTLDASKWQSNISRLAQTSTTPAPSLGTVNVTLKKDTWRTVTLNKRVPDEKYNFTRSEELTHSSMHAADKRGHFELMTRSTRITSAEKEKSSSNNSPLEMSLTDTTQSTDQHTRVSGVKPHNSVIHEDKRSPTPNRNESSQVRRDTQNVSSATSPTATPAARDPMRSEDNATTVLLKNERESIRGGKSLTETVTHLGKETSHSRVLSTRPALAEISTSIDKRMAITIDVKHHSNHSGDKSQPVMDQSTTKKLDRVKKVVTTGHPINEHSDTEVRERALKPVAVDLVTKSTRLTMSPPSRHSNIQDRSTKAAPTDYESKTKTSTLKSSHPTTATNFTRARAMTVEVTLASTRDTHVPEDGDVEDMLGMLEKRNRMVIPTFSSGEPTATFKQTSMSSLESSPDVPVERATKPQLVTVPQTKRTEEQTHTDLQARAEHTTSVEKLQTSSSKTPFPEGMRSQEPKVPSSEDVTSTSTEPTALVFDDGDDEDEDEDEARLHFPVVRISRRPSSTPRRPALMDLFSHRHLGKRSTTTLRPVLLNNIIARRGRHDHNQTTQRHRLQHDIAVRRRSHHESPPPRPYQMTLFYGEPLHAVRVAVKRRG